ncbi:MAG: MarR family transcriptional regulator [Polyangiaceae bacterium]
MKRAHHATLKVLRPIAARNDLTPARFDLMYTLHRNGRSERFPSIIARKLGVSRTTVAKMLGAMEKAGLLVRKIVIWDQRYRKIKLTRYGRRCFNRTMKELRRREIDAILHHGLGPLRSRLTRAAFLRELAETMRRVFAIPYNLWDTALWLEGPLYKMDLYNLEARTWV